MAIVKLGLSGGKDSTCAAFLHLERGDTVKAVCYIPFFTEEIPLLTKRHYEFILALSERLKKEGAEVFAARGMTYTEYVMHIATRGKFKGKPFGFPCFKRSQCGFKRDSKEKAIRAIDVGFFDYESVGIAADEPARFGILSDKKRSILVETGKTERFCNRFCYKRGVLSPHYEYAKRDGCVLCPNASELERNIWFQDYPQAKQQLIALQEFVKRSKPGFYPLRGKQWFIDTDQITFFD